MHWQFGEMEFGEMKRNTSNWSNIGMLLRRTVWQRQLGFLVLQATSTAVIALGSMSQDAQTNSSSLASFTSLTLSPLFFSSFSPLPSFFFRFRCPPPLFCPKRHPLIHLGGLGWEHRKPSPAWSGAEPRPKKKFRHIWSPVMPSGYNKLGSCALNFFLKLAAWR